MIILPSSVGLSEEADKMALEIALMLGGKKEVSFSFSGITETSGDEAGDSVASASWADALLWEEATLWEEAEESRPAGRTGSS